MKKAQTNLINIIVGLIIVSGGLLVAFDYVNFGLLLAGLGVVFEGFKIVLTQGLK